MKIEIKGTNVNFYVNSEKEVAIVFTIEKLLRKKGVSFDTGFNFIAQRRDWCLDNVILGKQGDK